MGVYMGGGVHMGFTWGSHGGHMGFTWGSHEGHMVVHMGFTWGSHGGYMGSHGVTWVAHYIEPCLCSVDYIIACKGGNMTTCTDVTFLCYQQG